MKFPRLGLYTLKGKTPIRSHDLLAWAEWMEKAKAKRSVAFTSLDVCGVSTVFLGLDYNSFGDVPMLFETMIFGGPLDLHSQRYSTWDEAEKGHEAIVNLAMARGARSMVVH